MTRTRQLILLLGDSISLIVAFVLMVLIRFGVENEWASLTTLAGPFMLMFLIWLVVLFICDLYDIKHVNPNPRNIGLLAIAIGINIIVGGFLFYVFPYFGIAPKLTLLITAACAFGMLVLWRRLFYKLFTSFFVRSIVVIGESAQFVTFCRTIAQNPYIGRIIAQFENVQKFSLARTTLERADVIITETHTPEELSGLADVRDAEIFSLRDAYEELFGRVPVELIREEWAMSLITKKEGFGYWLFSTAVNRIIAALVLIATAPFVLITMLAIALESGRPVIYSHRRTGRRSEEFTIYKLRSMRVDAEKNGAEWSTRNDARVTRVGRIIRKIHIDEIPQMYNVLKGDIALVGPRPERPEFVEKLEREIPYYFLRHTTKPGFTGWAQIKFHYAGSVMESREKFEYDLYYVKHRSVLLDLGIILKTVQIIFTH